MHGEDKKLEEVSVFVIGVKAVVSDRRLEGVQSSAFRRSTIYSNHWIIAREEVRGGTRKVARGNEKYESRERYITALFGGGNEKETNGNGKGEGQGRQG